MAKLMDVCVDVRLIHGRVLADILNSDCVEALVVADDTASGKVYRQGLMEMAVPNGIETFYWGICETVVRLKEELSDKNVLLIVKNLVGLNALRKEGLKLEHVTLSNTFFEDGIRLSDHVTVSEEELSFLNDIRESGCVIEVR